MRQCLCCRRDGERRKFINARYKILLWQMLEEAPIVTAGKACSIAMLSTVYAAAGPSKALPSGSYVVECAEDQLQRIGLTVACVFTAIFTVLAGLTLNRVPGLCTRVPGRMLAEIVMWTTNACFQAITSSVTATADGSTVAHRSVLPNATASNTTSAPTSQTSSEKRPETRAFAGLAIVAATVVTLSICRRPPQLIEQGRREEDHAAEGSGTKDVDGQRTDLLPQGRAQRVQECVVAALQGTAVARGSEQDSAMRRQNPATLPASQLFAQAMTLSAAFELSQGILPFVGLYAVGLHFLSVAVAARWLASTTTISTTGWGMAAGVGRCAGARSACAYWARHVWLTAIEVCGQVLILLSAFTCAQAINATVNPNGVTYEATYSAARVGATMGAFFYTIFTAWWSLRWMARRLDQQDRGAQNKPPGLNLLKVVYNLLTFGHCTEPTARVQSVYTVVFVESNNVAVGWAFERMCAMWMCGIVSWNISSTGDKATQAGLGLTTLLLTWAYSIVLSCGMLKRKRKHAVRREYWCDKLYSLRTDPEAHESDLHERADVSMTQISGSNPSVSGTLLRTRFD